MSYADIPSFFSRPCKTSASLGSSSYVGCWSFAGGHYLVRFKFKKVSSSARLCCTNRHEGKTPPPQTDLCHAHRLRGAKVCEPIEQGHPNMNPGETIP